MKKILSFLLLGGFIICFILSPLSAFALVRSGEGEASLLQEGEFEVLEMKQSKHLAGTANASAEEAVYQGLLNCDSAIDITQYRIPIADAVAFYSNVINDHPDLFFVSSTIDYNYYSSSGTTANLFPHYTMEKSEVEAALAVFRKGAERLLSEVNDSMSDIQKAVILHDAVCSLAHYPNVDLSTNDKDIYHSAYGLFYDGEVVCAGYTLAYSYLMNEAGVPCEYVASDPMGHAWNKVKIGNSWYNVDCTWDDMDYGYNKTLAGCVLHNNFLKSDAVFNTQPCGFHYSGETYDDCTATDTTYDSAFWNGVIGRIYAADADYIYLNNDASTHYCTVTRRTPSGVETALKRYYVSVAMNGGSTVHDADGNAYYNAHTDLLTRIVSLDNRFYVVAAKKLYSLKADGTEYTITSVPNFCIGLGADETDYLTYQLYSTPEEVATLDKLEYFQNYMTVQKGVNYNNYPDINYDLVINAKDFALIESKRK